MGLVAASKKFIKNNKVDITIITIMFLIDIIYLSNTTANVPIMDYWRYGSSFLDEIFNGGIRFKTLWGSISGQRGVLNYFLFFVNVKFFHWNTRIAIFFGAFVTYTTGLLILRIMDQFIVSVDNKAKFLIKHLATLSISYILFNYIQWEIKVLEFYAPFSIISFFVILNCWLADKILCDLQNNRQKVYSFTILLMFSICFIYSAFFPAVVCAIFLCGLINLIKNYKRDNLKYISSYMIVGIGTLTSSIFYMIDIEGVTGDSHNLSTFLISLVNGNYFKSILLFLGSSVVHVSLIEKIGFNLTFFIGCIIGIIYIYALYLFVKYKHNSYFPIMLIFYTLFVGTLLSYGRGSVFGVEYLISSRYAFQSKLGLIGAVLLICSNSINKKAKFHNPYIANVIVSGGIIIVLLISQVEEFKISPYRRLIYDTLIERMYNIDNLEDEDLQPFQADSPIYVRETVEYMKKYHLGVFYNIR